MEDHRGQERDALIWQLHFSPSRPPKGYGVCPRGRPHSAGCRVLTEVWLCSLPQSPQRCRPPSGMANRGPAYGLSREVQQKIEKQCGGPGADLIQWITTQCRKDVGRPQLGAENFQNWLKDMAQ